MTIEPRVIEFSHNYPKLHGQKTATLLAVLPIRIDKSTPKELLDYDTTYDGGRHHLPTGDYIQLVFIGEKRIPFCTIRKASPPLKYKGCIGNLYVVKIAGGGAE